MHRIEGIYVAEAVGFEPTMPFGITVFKTAAFNHSATPPHCYETNDAAPKTPMFHVKHSFATCFFETGFEMQAQDTI